MWRENGGETHYVYGMSQLNPSDEAAVNAPLFDNSYARLPDRFFARVEPAPASLPQLLAVNDGLAAQLGIDADWLHSEAGLAVLAGVKRVDGSDPLAMAYAGHQFGQFVPQLGDGRAILLGEVVNRNGVRFDLQLKGSGKTPFSRGGDGHAALGPVVREYILSEAMAALGVPTTRALAAISTGDLVYRETALPGGRIVRVAQSHVRVGTFQYFAARGDVEGLQALTDYVIARHYPAAAEAERPALALLDAVMAKQAALIAHWQSLGFIHGVMNTDNMSVAGETIDYGPCAIMDFFDPAQVYSSIDRNGRYAYHNQPGIGQWNLAVLAQALLPLIDADQDKAVELAQAAVDGFPALFEVEYLARFREKLGLVDIRDGDAELIEDLLKLMAAGRADFTTIFRQLAEAVEYTPDGLVTLFDGVEGLDEWLGRWRARLRDAGRDIGETSADMRSVNPVYIPRNHLVEAAIAAAYAGDFAPFEELNAVLARPFEAQADHEAYALPPQPDEVVAQTFCGT